MITVHTDFFSSFFFFSERAARGGGGGRCQTFSFSFFPCSADHERDWPPCKVVFFGLATDALNVRNNFSSQTGGCSEGLGAFRFFFKHTVLQKHLNPSKPSEHPSGGITFNRSLFETLGILWYAPCTL